MIQSEYLKILNDGNLQSAYLFLGEESLLHEEMLAATFHTLLQPEDFEFNLSIYDGATAVPEEVMNQLETPPFFGDVRVVCIKGPENSKQGLDELILRALPRLADGVYLLVSAFKLDARKNVTKELVKQLPVVSCEKLTPREIPQWISSRSTKMGLKLTPLQITQLAQRLGVELLQIRTELEKLAVYALENGGIVSDEAFDSLVPLGDESNVFALMDAVVSGDARQSMPRLQELLAAGEPELRLLTTITRQFRNIAAAIECRNLRLDKKTLASELGLKPFVIEKSMAQAGRYTMAQIQRITDRLLQADYRIKTGQSAPRLELETAIVEISRYATKR